MTGGKLKTPARGQAQPGQDGRSATAAGTCNLAQSGDECHCADELARTADTLQDATAAVRLLEIMADLRCQAVRHD